MTRLDRRGFLAGTLLVSTVPPARALAQAAAGSLIDQLARMSGGIVKLAEAFEKVLDIGYRLEDVVRRREEDGQLRSIHAQLTSLYLAQAELLDGWPVLSAPPPAERWQALRQRMVETRARVDAVRASLARYAGTYALERTDDFLALGRIGAMRSATLSAAATIGVPTTADQFAAANALRARYAELLGNFRRLTVAMGRYIALPAKP